MDWDTEDEESGLSLLEYMPAGVLLEIFKFLDWNNICQVACTCTKFRDVCQSATLWLQLKELDFRMCAVPDPEKILNTLKRTPNACHLILGDVLIDGTCSELQTQDDNLSPSDRFLLNALKLCPRITRLDLYMENISDLSVDAICGKCTELQSLEIHSNGKITTEAMCELVSLHTGLKEILMDSCEEIRFPEIKHTDPQKHLNLQKISLQGQMVMTENIRTLLRSCPLLKSLDLTATDCLNTFNMEITQGHGCGLDCLETVILQACTGLQTVDLPYCPNLELLDVSFCRQLVEVTATTPRLKKLQVQGCEKLKKINLSSSDLSELQCQEMAELDTLHVGSGSLQALDLLNCKRLSTEQLLGALVSRKCLSWLNISGCKNIPPSDVCDTLLVELSGLQTLLYGGHSWNNVRLTSQTLTQFQFVDCINTSCVLLDMPHLEDLSLSKCRDFVEQELVDSILHGRLLTRLQGLESIKTTYREQSVFQSGGVPELHTLRCHDLPGIHGDVLSHGLTKFSYLACVELVHCTFLEHLSVIGWPSLETLRVESCNRLRQLTVQHVDTLHTLYAKWCSMVDHCLVDAVQLCSMDVTGTNFAHLCIICNKLHTLHLNGVCTQPTHTLQIRCNCLEKLSISKCDRLSDETVNDIFTHSPNLKAFTLMGSLSVSNLTIPVGIEECSLTGHRALRQVTLKLPAIIHSLSLNHLPKFVPDQRQMLLEQCRVTLKNLELRAIAGETILSIRLPKLQCLTLYQGLQLVALEVNCPVLKYLRIQGCPKLSSLMLHVESVTQVQVLHSPPLLALRNLMLYSKQVVHLARVLAHYCPHLVELTLWNSELRSSQLYALGLSLPELTTIKLHSCTLKNSQTSVSLFIIGSAELGRSCGMDLHVVNSTV